jgi:NAD(P)H-flavin reductase
LRNYYKFYYYQQPIEEVEKKEVPSVAGKLCFFIKEYKRGLFTRFLLNAPKDRVFSLTGPFGSGLRLKEKLAGYYVIIAAGIGIVPFVDLFSYMLQKTLYDLIKIKASNPSLRKIVQEECSY